MLLYFKPGSHPWDTRIQVLALWTGVLGGTHNDLIEDHYDAAHFAKSDETDESVEPDESAESVELSRSQWVTLCLCEGWK